MPLDMKGAFRRQAISDYHVFELLKKNKVEICHQLHYIQMCTEKLAKSLNPVPGDPKSVHPAFVHFVRNTAIRHDAFRRACKMKTKDAFRAYLQSLEPMAQDIEDLAPEATQRRLNPEYPWKSKIEDPQKPGHWIEVVHVPAEYSFSNLVSHPKMIKMKKFLEAIFPVVQQWG
jgi:hypothetical protein